MTQTGLLVALLFSVSLSLFCRICDGLKLQADPTEIKVQIRSSKVLKLSVREMSQNTSLVIVTSNSQPSVVEVPNKILFKHLNQKKMVKVQGHGIGKATVTFSVQKNHTSYDTTKSISAQVTVRVVHSLPLTVINAVIGWLYFTAWSVSFYPQVYLNWKRQSVVGLNFDFLAFNITGFIAYGLFNIGMFWIPTVKDEYFAKHPGGINPVQPNDVFFTVHAIIITFITILQCLFYEREDQKVSFLAKILLSCTWLFAAIAFVVTLFHKITWLTYLYYFSYIKIGVTLIKYIPQAWMNFRRHSTIGWSIGNVLLDFTGGSLSILQMFLLAYNNDDWNSIFGDFTKFGLGAISILFDVLFMVQHYCLYRPKGNLKYEEIGEKEDASKEETDKSMTSMYGSLS